MCERVSVRVSVGKSEESGVRERQCVWGGECERERVCERVSV